jgi:hypothetical protein
VLVPEIKDKKGAILNKVVVPSKDEWLVDLRVHIGNEARTERGGAGLGLYYLRELDQAQIGSGVFGYSREYNGLAVFLNSLFASSKDGKMMNWLQAFPNDGTQMTNPMKVKGEKNCQVVFRNQPQDKPFHVRLEYQKPRVSLFFFDHEQD